MSSINGYINSLKKLKTLKKIMFVNLLKKTPFISNEDLT